MDTESVAGSNKNPPDEKSADEQWAGIVSHNNFNANISSEFT